MNGYFPKCKKTSDGLKPPNVNSSVLKNFYNSDDWATVYKNTCIHCNKNEPSYCESCYQELIAENMRLKVELENIKILNK